MEDRLGLLGGSLDYSNAAEDEFHDWQRLARDGAVSNINSPEEFSAFIADDHRKWAKVIKAANIHVSE